MNTSVYVRSTLFFMVVFLTSCSQFVTMGPSKASLDGCRATCEKRNQECNLTCRDTCQNCKYIAKKSSLRAYNFYRHEQFVEDGVIARELKSYRDPLQCRKTSCSCIADYQVCMQSCGGVIHKQLQTFPVC